MRVLFFKIIIVCCFSSIAIGQEKDSILKSLENYTLKDTIRAKHLIDASSYLTHKNPQKALEYINEGLSIGKAENWQRGIALALTQKGAIYYTMADNLRAMEFFLRALSITEKIRDEELTINLFNNLANIYADMKNFKKALEYYHKYLDFAIAHNNRINRIKALNNIGNVYNDTKSIDKAITYFNKALQLSKEEENDFFIAAITNNIGISFKRKKEYKNALKYFNDVVIITDKINNKYIMASALNSLAKVNILLDEFNIAKNYAEKALKVSKEIEAVEWQADSWEVLYKVHESNNENKQALLAYKSFIQFRDSVATEEKKAALTKKDMQYQLDKQEVIANAKIKRQAYIKNTAIGIGVFLLLFSVFGYLLYKRKRDAEQQKEIADFKAEMVEIELKALRSQMNPHFIFNSLNSISDYLLKNDVTKANEYLVKFSKLTRAILENSEKKWIPLKEDLELLKLYIELESLRLKNKLSYNIEIDENIDIENTLIPPLILQPFIENSIWHGISKKEDNGTLLIEINKHDQQLICAVEDDGVGKDIALKELNEKSSMGITITNQRLEIINKVKQIKGAIHFMDKKQGLRVELSLPLELRF